MKPQLIKSIQHLRRNTYIKLSELGTMPYPIDDIKLKKTFSVSSGPYNLAENLGQGLSEYDRKAVNDIQIDH